MLQRPGPASRRRRASRGFGRPAAICVAGAYACRSHRFPAGRVCRHAGSRRQRLADRLTAIERELAQFSLEASDDFLAVPADRGRGSMPIRPSTPPGAGHARARRQVSCRCPASTDDALGRPGLRATHSLATYTCGELEAETVLCRSESRPGVMPTPACQRTITAAAARQL